MVFQSYAIWPHMTVYDNVAFPLQHGTRKHSRQVVQDKVMRALSLVQLDSYAQRPAPLLSGGQQQRVALARAIANEPTVLLLDEPLSNLDAKLREEMRHQIKDLAHRLETTTLYVTHDQLEALSMSDTVALVRDGLLIQEGAPRDVYLRPADAFAANFLGRTNLLEGRVVVVAPGGLGTIETQWGQAPVSAAPMGSRRHGADGRLSTRGRAAVGTPAPTGSSLEGTVAASSFAGDTVEYRVDLGGRTIGAKGQPFELFADGQRVFVLVPPERCYVLDSISAPV